ncbi:hypothetical protein [Muricoccus radiodurans]|uniref:hypothetical protein n=1 Tax=Muricoccus radiodurans TaxID=2231721 RepID=UPI003CF389D5
MRTRRMGTAARTAEAGWTARRLAGAQARARVAERRASTAPPALPSAPRASAEALAYLAAETLELGCLYGRRGSAHVRLPIHLRQQDGPCEWHAHRVGGRLSRVTYTCERLEDWTALAEREPETIPGLYRGLLNRTDIGSEDLFWTEDVFTRAPSGDYALAFPRGAYNPLNVWNTLRGAVHAIRRAVRNGPGAVSPNPCLRLPVLPVVASDGRDVTAEVLRVTRRAPADGRVLRIEAAPPPEAPYALDDLILPGGERFTPGGLAAHLVDSGPARGRQKESAWIERTRDGLPAFDFPPRTRTLPGGLVAAAMLQLAGFPDPRAAAGWRHGHA